MKKILTAVALTAGLMTAACGDRADQIDQCLQAQNQQECAQVRDAGGDVSQYLIGGLGGYMLAKMMTPSGPRYYMQPNPNYHGTFQRIPSYDRSYGYVRRPGYRPYSVVHKTVINNYPTRRVVTTTKTRNSVFGGGTRTVTKTVTYRKPASSWGSSSYRKPSSSWGSSSSRSTWSSSGSSRSSWGSSSRSSFRSGRR